MSEPDFSPAHVGQLLSQAARQWPNHPAVAEPVRSGWRHVTFAELEHDSNTLGRRLVEHGVGRGLRMGLFVPPGIRFVSLVFALFKSGATVIFIDPGLGPKGLMNCLSHADPHGMVAIAKAHLLRRIYRHRFPNSRLNFVSGRRWWPGCVSLDVAGQANGPDESITDSCFPPLRLNDDAAIIFTSGSTGPAKGVCYTHGNFVAQAREIRDWFGIEPGGADVSGFPLFALFNVAMGVTTIFPEMDFARPAKVNPEKFFAAASRFNANQSFGSPALWNAVSRWAESNSRQLASMRRVMSAGAPVPSHVLQRIRKTIADGGEAYTPYGATEALPVSCTSASIVLGETAQRTALGAGVCVGPRFRQIEWRVVEIDDGPLPRLEDARPVSRGVIGELIVRGLVVTRGYWMNPQADLLAKIADGDSFWHRMGDVGYLDEHDRFWFCGRKSHRVITLQGTLFTVPCESIINTHPAIYRSALVGAGPPGEQTPAIVAEPWPEHWPSARRRRERLIDELRELARRHEMTASLGHFFLQRHLPVDSRHNSKIFRERLRPMVARHIAKQAF